MMTMLLALVLAQQLPGDPPYTELTEQKLRIRFRDDASAAKGWLEILPLYGGAEWAISSRWDDNIYTDLKMRDVLEKHGYRGTFYLNGRDIPYYGPTYDLVDQKEQATIDRRLLAGGNTIGGHSWTHAYVPYCNRRRIFEEILRVRIDREASSDTPVTSYAFSFTSKRNDLEGTASRWDIVDAVRRSGYIHVANGAFNEKLDTGLSISWLLPHDGRPIDEAFEKLLADPGRHRQDPNISFNMHVWYTTPGAWEKFEGQLAKYGRRPGWWYCNQNQYAAYRRQFRYSTLKTTQRGATYDTTLRRPSLLDLGDPIPLTLIVRGAPADAVLSADIDGVPAVVEAGRINVPPTSQLPTKIGWIDGEGTDPDFPKLRAALQKDGDMLQLSILNDGDAPLENVRLLYRLPLEWKEGVVTKHLGSIPRGRFIDRLALKVDQTDAKYTSGTAFYAAQIDWAGGRLHVTARSSDPKLDPSYPRDRFLVAGPIADADFKIDQTAGLAWREIDPAKSDFLDVEVVPTSLAWRFGGTDPIWYLATSFVDSEEERKAGVVIDRGSVKALYVNGERVDGTSLTLRKGENRILLASKIADKFRPENAGAFFRLTDENGRRLTTVRYRSR
jgi:peptidoglycan/xylan/chitin deacetylase (PgdA/CDA1 family)